MKTNNYDEIYDMYDIDGGMSEFKSLVGEKEIPRENPSAKGAPLTFRPTSLLDVSHNEHPQEEESEAEVVVPVAAIPARDPAPPTAAIPARDPAPPTVAITTKDPVATEQQGFISGIISAMKQPIMSIAPASIEVKPDEEVFGLPKPSAKRSSGGGGGGGSSKSSAKKKSTTAIVERPAVRKINYTKIAIVSVLVVGAGYLVKKTIFKKSK